MPPTSAELEFIGDDIPAKECPGCKILKPLTDYYKNKNSYLGVLPYCKPCTTKRNYAYITPEKKFKRSRQNILKSFNITLDDYNKLLTEQNYGCAICGLKDINLSLHVDHNHITNKIRGLLCKRCNSGIGMFREDINLIKNAVDYLEKAGEK